MSGMTNVDKMNLLDLVEDKYWDRLANGLSVTDNVSTMRADIKSIEACQRIRRLYHWRGGPATKTAVALEMVESPEKPPPATPQEIGPDSPHDGRV